MTSPECPLQGQDVLRIWDGLIAAANRSPSRHQTWVAA
jgi:hypothetical protein